MQVVSRRTNAEFSGDLRPNRCRMRMIVGESTFYSPVRMFVKFFCVSHGNTFSSAGVCTQSAFRCLDGQRKIADVFVELCNCRSARRFNVFT
jgi:hypothetical protein